MVNWSVSLDNWLKRMSTLPKFDQKPAANKKCSDFAQCASHRRWCSAGVFGCSQEKDRLRTQRSSGKWFWRCRPASLVEFMLLQDSSFRNWPYHGMSLAPYRGMSPELLPYAMPRLHKFLDVHITYWSRGFDLAYQFADRPHCVLFHLHYNKQQCENSNVSIYIKQKKTPQQKEN